MFFLDVTHFLGYLFLLLCCYGWREFHSFRRAGKNHPLWKGGFFPCGPRRVIMLSCFDGEFKACYFGMKATWQSLLRRQPAVSVICCTRDDRPRFLNPESWGAALSILARFCWGLPRDPRCLICLINPIQPNPIISLIGLIFFGTPGALLESAWSPPGVAQGTPGV